MIRLLTADTYSEATILPLSIAGERFDLSADDVVVELCQPGS
jgi:hypothetical protein